MRLTAAVIRTLTPPPGKTDFVHFDEDLPGFGLRVRATGAKTWMIQYAIGGRTRRMVLGPVALLDPGKARSTARDLLAQVRLGRDPAKEKFDARATSSSETFGLLLPRFLARQKERLKPRSYDETKRHLVMHCRTLHGRPIAAIERRAIATLLADIAETRGPAASNRVRASLSAFFTWAAREGLLDTGQHDRNLNPVVFTNKAIEKGARARVLVDDELRTIWLAAGDDRYGAIIKLLILTGARRDEIASLARSEVDFIAATATLPPARTKNRREHVIPLSEPALRILLAQPPRFEADTDLFFGPGRNRNWSGGKASLDARIAGKPLEHWTPHDFRRSLSTVLHERFGVAPHVVEVILGHVGGHQGGVAGTYNRALYLDERRRALDLWAQHIMGLIEQ
jgi:integrase